MWIMGSITVDQIQRLARELSPADQLRLVEELAHGLRQQQDIFSPDFPVSASAEAIARVLAPEDFSDWEDK